ncbi:hypothetical protein MEN24_03930, partial [Dolichospermum sp. ST_sed10]|nr:hypothetical protein [Dolichospermum sp. ST_sed10]
EIHHLHQNHHKNHSSDSRNYRLNCDLSDFCDFGDSEVKFIIFIKIITKIIVQTVEGNYSSNNSQSFL